MDDISLEIERVQRMVDTACQEIELAVMLHETWRPAANDADLHVRIGASYAGHAFLVIRLSLRRELLLALCRVWDTNPRAVKMAGIRDKLREKRFFDALVQHRAERLGLNSSFAHAAVKAELESTRDMVLNLIEKYLQGGSGAKVLERLKKLRHEHLAHRQLPIAPAALDSLRHEDVQGESGDLATSDEIEAFYQDNLRLISLLLSLVKAHSYDLSETAAVYKHHAKYFWASARGERTEGHPDFRSPLSSS